MNINSNSLSKNNKIKSIKNEDYTKTMNHVRNKTVNPYKINRYANNVQWAEIPCHTEKNF